MENAFNLQSHKRRLKHNRTRSERVFADLMNQAGIQFKQQMILGFYILDFCIPDRMLNIEIDGSSHDRKRGKDAWRDKFVRDCGFEVVRIKNEDIHTFDMSLIRKTPLASEISFRSALGRANSLRSKAIQKQKAIDILK